MRTSLVPINVNVPFNSKRILLKALLCSVFLLAAIVVLDFLSASQSRPDQSTPFTFVVAIFIAITVYFWATYMRSRRNFLQINAEYISWKNQHKKAKVLWSFIRKVNIVDLSEKLGRSKYLVYDFTLDARETALPSPITLYASDYEISHPELLELIEQAAKKYSFQVLLERQ